MNDILDSQISLPCGVILKNRICKSALTERIAEGDNLVNQKPVDSRFVGLSVIEEEKTGKKE